jgi:hypothetical protein
MGTLAKLGVHDAPRITWMEVPSLGIGVHARTWSGGSQALGALHLFAAAATRKPMGPAHLVPVRSRAPSHSRNIPAGASAAMPRLSEVQA